MNPDTIYVYSQITVPIAILLIANLLLAGLVWYNLKEIRRCVKSFMDGDKAEKIAIALEKQRLAEIIRDEFLHHTHGQDGKVK